MDLPNFLFPSASDDISHGSKSTHLSLPLCGSTLRRPSTSTANLDSRDCFPPAAGEEKKNYMYARWKEKINNKEKKKAEKKISLAEEQLPCHAMPRQLPFGDI